MSKPFKVLQRCDKNDEDDEGESVFWEEHPALEFPHGYPDAGVLGRAYGAGAFLLWETGAYDVNERVVAVEPTYLFEDTDD